jgi:hypothetical protein
LNPPKKFLAKPPEKIPGENLPKKITGENPPEKIPRYATDRVGTEGNVAGV